MISIVIPTLNEASVIKNTLTSLKKLTAVDHEIIISDGHSQDQTVAIAKKFTKNIVTYQGTKRQTIANARNLGAHAAQGEYLVFMDADVTVVNPNNFFSSLIKTFEKCPQLAGVTVSLRVHKYQETWKDRVFFGLVNLVHRFVNNILHQGSASGEFQMVRRKDFQKIGGFNEDLVAHEDNDFFQRLAKVGKTRVITDQNVFHTGRRVHKVGHVKLLTIWITNMIWFLIFRRAWVKEWEPIR